jgi:transcription-repair coupling factor (superfamily II helicase)
MSCSGAWPPSKPGCRKGSRPPWINTTGGHSLNVSGLLSWLSLLGPYRALLGDLERGEKVSPLGLVRSARATIIASIAHDLAQPLLVVTGPVDRAKTLTQSIRDWSPRPESISRFLEPLTLFYERAPWSEEVIAARLSVLSTLQRGASTPVIITSARALMQRTLPLHSFRSATVEFRIGQTLDLKKTLARWAGQGYEPVSVVLLQGQFSHRGGILDIYPPASPGPVRFELFGSNIESLRRFDPATQRSRERLESVIIGPAREALPQQGPRISDLVAEQISSGLPEDELAELETHRQGLKAGTPFPGLEFYLPCFHSETAMVLDYMPDEALVVLDDEQELAETWAGLEQEALELRDAAERAGMLPADYPLPYVTWDEWLERLTDRQIVSLAHGQHEGASALSDCFLPSPHFGGQLKPLLTHMATVQAKESHVVVVSQQARRLAELWAAEHGRSQPPVHDEISEVGHAHLLLGQGSLGEGWILRGLDLGKGPAAVHLLTDAEVFGWRRPQPRRPVHRRRVSPEAHFSDLSPGDFVVHIEYGIGIFEGLVTRATESMEREYFLVRYSGSDRLYVPIHQADRLSRYIGADDSIPQLSKLGSTDWQSVKARAKEAVDTVARDLLELYAARELAVGHAFSADTPWQAELEAGFPYFETEDQARAISAVKADMEKPKPMDRLICGDVGYGKTEVALRAAFKAVMDGKQVAMLVPTTVLAQQHFAAFRRRLAHFPVELEMLSRFRSHAEQHAIVEKLARGQIDVVIGTHRLLQKDVVFADLGLLIVDEEQRFGVTHKERLKQMRTEVDVLTLTATPIPRTLYMALTGVRDISTIETPPEERLPVSTYVGNYSEQLVRRAALRELERGGQVFYVHNRVRTIETARHKVVRLVPEATVSVAHGQMREAELEDVMLRFAAGELDVLVCTSIIESGLDIPNANTLIVERAERFGLAQLYQLRGRVGRAAQRAYAYFFHSRLSRLTPDARRRLETIREASELGSGYSIAMRDLEIRGTGDILGTRQSGHIGAVGFDLYTRLLTRAVQEQRAKRDGRPPPREALASIRIELPLTVRLPEDYVPDAGLRLQIYRRLAQLESTSQIGEMQQELADRFGPLPDAAQNLFYQLRLKALARDAGVAAIVTDNGQLALRSTGLDYPNRDELRQALRDRAVVSRRELFVPIEAGWREQLARVLRDIARIAKAAD